MAKMYYTESGALKEIDNEKVYMSREGYEEAAAYLKYLQTEKRDEIVARISEARSHGDLSENAEYDAARNEKARLWSLNTKSRTVAFTVCPLRTWTL